MFDLDNPEVNYLNRNCIIYQEIAKIAKLFHQIAALRFGRMYFREISGNGRDFGLPQSQPCTLAFSRILPGEEVLIAYNTSTTERRNDFVIVDSDIHNKPGNNMKFIYGKQATIPVQKHADNESRFIQLELEPMQFVILQ